MWMKEQIDKNRNTIDSYKNVDFLLINTSIKHSKYVVNKTIDHFDDASFWELIDRIRVGFFLQNDICPFIKQGI